MEANELRIGNYVFEEYGGTYEVININLEGFEYADLKKPTFKAIGRYGINSIKGIKLTEEILLKCGYFKVDSGGVIHFYIKGHSIWLCNELFLCEKNGIIIRNLHQLQNLYFALTNEELTINL